MKKNVIAILLSLVVAVSSIGPVPVIAAETAAARAERLAEQFDDVVNAPHYSYDEQGHLIFVYGREVG